MGSNHTPSRESINNYLRDGLTPDWHSKIELPDGRVRIVLLDSVSEGGERVLVDKAVSPSVYEQMEQELRYGNSDLLIT